MQFIWYEFCSDNVGSLHFIRLFHWSSGPNWSLEHAGSIHFSSDRSSEGCPTHLHVASLEVTAHLCWVLFIQSPAWKQIWLVHIWCKSQKLNVIYSVDRLIHGFFIIVLLIHGNVIVICVRCSLSPSLFLGFFCTGTSHMYSRVSAPS